MTSFICSVKNCQNRQIYTDIHICELYVNKAAINCTNFKMLYNICMQYVIFKKYLQNKEENKDEERVAS